MEKPFRFIEYRIIRRDQFKVTQGRQPTWALLLIKEGSFRLRIGERESVIRAGECALFTDDVDFSRSVIEPISFVFLQFCVNPKCPFTLPLPSGKIEFRDGDRFLSNIALYEALVESEDARAVYCREHALEDILLQIYTEQVMSDSGTARGEALAERLLDCHDELVRRAVRYIRANLGARLAQHSISQAVLSNPSTLNFKFRRELSQSVGEFLIAERMRLARRLLHTTTYPIGSIALRCGYENIYYFSTAFRKANGVSPKAFRRRLTR